MAACRLLRLLWWWLSWWQLAAAARYSAHHIAVKLWLLHHQSIGSLLVDNHILIVIFPRKALVASRIFFYGCRRRHVLIIMDYILLFSMVHWLVCSTVAQPLERGTRHAVL